MNQATRIGLLVTSTSYPMTHADWRGVFIRHMVAALARRNDLRVTLWAPPGPLPAGVADATSTAERRMLNKLMQEGGIAHLLRNHRFSGLAAAVRLIWGLRRAFRTKGLDVYHVNWLQCALALPKSRTPVLITVLGNDMRLLQLPGMRMLVTRALRGRNVVICPNANWMVEPLKASFGNLAEVEAVSFGIDPRWFELNREFVDADDWLLVSRLTKKKIGPLLKWGEVHFKHHPRRCLHVIGPMQEEIDLPEWVQYHGSASPEDLRETWFPRAAGLVTLSEHDEGRPQVLLEAMASGLPIIASKLPAHTDLIEHGIDGMIVTDETSFSDALNRLEVRHDNRMMGLSGRQKILRDMGTWDDCASRYAALYGELLSKRA